MTKRSKAQDAPLDEAKTTGLDQVTSAPPSPSPLERFLEPEWKQEEGREGELRLVVPRGKRETAGQGLEVLVRGAAQERWLPVDGMVDEAVIDSAIARSERLLTTLEAGQWLVVGGVRTRATPGCEPVETVRIEARTIHLEATERLALVSGSSQLLLRAVGSVETLARNITHRASEVQKVIGRMLHLN